MFDLIVVGSGLSGAIVAREFALTGKKVLILEKRDHVGGNVYDEKKSNILVHKYGPHIFHTNNKEVYEYMNQFWTLNSYRNEVKGFVKNNQIPIPFNFKGIDIFFSKNANSLKKKLIGYYGEGARVSVMHLMENKDPEIQKIAHFIFNNIFKNYSTKMWGTKVRDIDPKVLQRVPVAISYSTTYFNDKYEGIPIGGYTKALLKILKHKNITIRTLVDASKLITLCDNKIFFKKKFFNNTVVYSGPLDEFFKYKFGSLPYRSLSFKFKNYNKRSFQDSPVLNMPAHPTATRSVEYKKMTFQKGKNTVVSTETPGAFNKDSKIFHTPYYPVTNATGKEQYDKYAGLARKIKNFYPVGRLATFKYINMDETVAQALSLSKKLLIQKHENSKK